MALTELFTDRVRNERGSVIVILALSMTVLIGMAALVTDIGVNFVKQTQLSVAADAAALGGATRLPQGRVLAEQAAIEIAKKNGVPADEVSVSITEDGNSIAVTTHAPIKLFFARLFHKEEGQMAQSAAASLVKPVAMHGVGPLGLYEDAVFEFGTSYTLKSGTMGGTGSGAGQYGVLQLSDQTGSNIYGDHLKYGYDGLIAIGDKLDPETGNKTGDTRAGILDRLERAAQSGHECSVSSCPPGCPRIMIIPIYRVTVWQGNTVKEMEIVNFAAFWISALSNDGKEIKGQFLRITRAGAVTEIGESPYGISSVKLME